MVDEVPDMAGRDIPTVAIITGAYCEKLAVDAMMDFKTSYVHYKLDGEFSKDKFKIHLNLN